MGRVLRILIPLATGLSAWAATPAWPVSRETESALIAAPDAAKADELRAASNAAFDKRNHADAVALRKLEKVTRFLAKHPVPEGLRRWMMENRETTTEFADLLSPRDKASEVASILTELWTGDEAGFRKYPALAFAIALVYDTPCPAFFPHSQVLAAALPRRLHPPAEVFAFFKESADGGRLIQSPARLGVDELAFVVPVLAPLKELREVQRRRIGRADIPKLYPSIQYDTPRFRNRVMVWPHRSYSLETIRARGGICVDQAYYTTTVAQAFGVPAFILSGAGNGGFHAFTGFLEKPGKWRTDVGRYANQKYATGAAINPLTWGELTDHDLAFLESRFRSSPAYATAELSVTRAREFLAAGDREAAARLLQSVKVAEPRCPELWRALDELAEAQAAPPAARRALYAEAAKALGKFRELEIVWRAKLADSFEREGSADAAMAERLAIVRRNAEARPEAACELAGEIMANIMKAGDRRRTLQVFNRLSGQFEDAGPEFFLKVAYPVVGDLLKAGMTKEAKQLVRGLSQKFHAEPDSTLAEMQADLASCVAAGSMKGGKFAGRSEK